MTLVEMGNLYNCSGLIFDLWVKSCFTVSNPLHYISYYQKMKPQCNQTNEAKEKAECVFGST